MNLSLSETPNTGFLTSQPIWASMGENLHPEFVNNQGADQPVHPYSLISTFVNCLLECTLVRLATSEPLI